jgi:hypothetical protein
MTRLKQILAGNGQLEALGKMPTEPGVNSYVGMYPLHGERADITVRRIELKSLGQIEKRLRGCLIVRA